MPRSGIQLCYPFEEKRLEKWKPPYLVQPKLDGERCRALPSTDYEGQPLWWDFISSELNSFNFAIPHIVGATYDQASPTMELDGELYSHELYLEGGFDLIHSIVSRRTNLHPRFEEMEYHIYDHVVESPQYKRYQDLDKLKGCIKPPLQIVPTYGAVSLEDVMQIYDHILSKGYEGIVVRHIDAPYVRRRSIYVMKFKPKKDDYYKIVGYKRLIRKDEYFGKNPLKNILPKTLEESIYYEKFGMESLMGALVCIGNDIHVFGVAGFEDSDKESFWRDREDLIGKTCHVEYQNITSGKGVPRFGIYKEIVESEPEIRNPLLD